MDPKALACTAVKGGVTLIVRPVFPLASDT